MKKAALCLLALACLIGLAGCGGGRLGIENRTWSLYAAAKVDKQNLTRTPVCQSELHREETGDDSQVVDCTLSAEDGTFLITDRTNGKEYEGAYFDPKEAGKSVTFSLTCGTLEGYAVLSSTQRENQEGEETLLVVLGDYTIYFYHRP